MFGRTWPQDSYPTHVVVTVVLVTLCEKLEDESDVLDDGSSVAVLVELLGLARPT